MKLSVSEHVDNLDEFKCIQLRNHIGNTYNIAEEVKNCNPEKDYDIQRRKITESPSTKHKDCIVPILTLSINSKEKAHTMFKNIINIAEEYNSDLHDVWYDTDKNEMIIFMEPFNLS